ncbi:MAG: T9SS type A sorting domain-containing protein, partial [bacterium]
PLNNAPNVLRIQVDNGAAETPVEVTVTSDPVDPFNIKRDPLDAYTNVIPSFNPSLTVKTVGSGKVTLNPPGGLYDPGQVVWLKAEPAPGYEFRYWEGDVVGSKKTETIFMDSHKNVTATFTPIGSNGIVTHEETQTGTSFATSVVVASGLGAADNDLYLAAVSSSPKRDVTAVSGMGLTWTQLSEQCSGNGQNGVETWWAQGQPNSDGTVTAIFSASTNNAVIAVSRYGNVDPMDPIGDIVSANPNGVQGDCTSGALTGGFSFDLTATETGAVAYGAIALQTEMVTSGQGYTQRAQVAGGTNDPDARLVVQDRTVPNASTISVTGEFSSQFVDWAAIGMVIRPPHAVAKPGASDLELTDIPKMYALDQNYPNPFNPSTLIKFALPKDSEVSLKLYDLLGREVMRLANGNFKAGRHSIKFEPKKLSSGVYMYELRVGKFKQSRRLIFIK